MRNTTRPSLIQRNGKPESKIPSDKENENDLDRKKKTSFESDSDSQSKEAASPCLTYFLSSTCLAELKLLVCDYSVG